MISQEQILIIEKIKTLSPEGRCLVRKTVQRHLDVATSTVCNWLRGKTRMRPYVISIFSNLIDDVRRIEDK